MLNNFITNQQRIFVTYLMGKLYHKGAWEYILSLVDVFSNLFRRQSAYFTKEIALTAL